MGLRGKCLRRLTLNETAIATAQNENITFKDGSNTNMVMTGNNGYFGVGDTDPLARLHVKNVDTGFSDENIADLYVEDSDAHIYVLSTEGGETGSTVSLVEVNSGTGLETDRWMVQRETTDGSGNSDFNIRYHDGTSPNTVFQLTTAGNLYLDGTVNPPSDRNLKENFEPIDTDEVLQRVSEMEITRWNYKSDSQVEHIGPMAQDFYTSFGLGSDDKHISTIDADGVALAAIQGLNEKLERENAELRERVEKLEAVVESLAKE